MFEHILASKNLKLTYEIDAYFICKDGISNTILVASNKKTFLKPPTSILYWCSLVIYEKDNGSFSFGKNRYGHPVDHKMEKPVDAQIEAVLYGHTQERENFALQDIYLSLPYARAVPGADIDRCDKLAIETNVPYYAFAFVMQVRESSIHNMAHLIAQDVSYVKRLLKDKPHLSFVFRKFENCHPVLMNMACI